MIDDLHFDTRLDKSVVLGALLQAAIAQRKQVHAGLKERAKEAAAAPAPAAPGTGARPSWTPNWRPSSPPSPAPAAVGRSGAASSYPSHPW
ncbi:hypothetical protein GXW82_44580 [Streptacidiphilus sp. 4-A2]|nr:hypothetical protein [Streptacidiphilus sp. 4-A2]